MKYFFLTLSTLLAVSPAMRAAETAPEHKFSFDDPAGPQFTDVQKQGQREKGAQIVPLVRKAFDGGAESVVIPPGEYRFGKESWGPDGPLYPLEFRGLKRDAAHPLRIIAREVTFWFDLPPDQAPHAHFALGFVDCSHLTLEGATLDRDPRGNLEGRITNIDAAGKRIEIEASKGSFVPTTFNGRENQRVVPFNADGTFCTVLYALQGHAPGRLMYRGLDAGTRPGRYWVNLDARSELLNVNGDPAWRRAYGDAGTLQVGDGLSLVHSTTMSVSVRNCTQLSFIGLRNYITKGGVRELYGGGGHLWKDCYFGPRPGTCHWQGGEGILTGCMQRGCIYDGLTMIHTTDDLLDIHGFWGYIEKAQDNAITIQRDHQMPAQPGDRLNFYDRQTGDPLGMAVVEAVNEQTLTLSRDAAPFSRAIAENTQRQSNGWEIRNCTFRDCYQRLLVQGGSGTLRDSHFIRVGSSVDLHSNFFTRNEGGICRSIAILNNTFDDVAIHPEGVTIRVGFEPLNRRARVPLLSDITVRDNRFVNSAKHALEMSLTTQGEIAGNTFCAPGKYRELAGKEPPREGPQPVQIKDCVSVAVRGNRLISSHRQIPPAASTGSRVVHAGGNSVNIVCDP